MVSISPSHISPLWSLFRLCPVSCLSRQPCLSPPCHPVHCFHPAFICHSAPLHFSLPSCRLFSCQCCFLAEPSELSFPFKLTHLSIFKCNTAGQHLFSVCSKIHTSKNGSCECFLICHRYWIKNIGGVIVNDGHFPFIIVDHTRDDLNYEFPVWVWSSARSSPLLICVRVCMDGQPVDTARQSGSHCPIVFIICNTNPCLLIVTIIHKKLQQQMYFKGNTMLRWKCCNYAKSGWTFKIMLSGRFLDVLTLWNGHSLALRHHLHHSLVGQFSYVRQVKNKSALSFVYMHSTQTRSPVFKGAICRNGPTVKFILETNISAAYHQSNCSCRGLGAREWWCLHC